MRALPHSAFLLLLPFSRTHAFLLGVVVRSNSSKPCCRDLNVALLATNSNNHDGDMEGRILLSERVSRADAVRFSIRTLLVAGAAVVVNGVVPSACEAARSTDELVSELCYISYSAASPCSSIAE